MKLKDQLWLFFQWRKLKRELEMKKSSWKTTAAGLITALGPIIKPSLPDGWEWISDALLSVGALLLGFAARDNNVSSEQAGAKK